MQINEWWLGDCNYRVWLFSRSISKAKRQRGNKTVAKILRYMNVHMTSTKTLLVVNLFFQVCLSAYDNCNIKILLTLKSEFFKYVNTAVFLAESI